MVLFSLNIPTKGGALKLRSNPSVREELVNFSTGNLSAHSPPIIMVAIARYLFAIMSKQSMSNSQQPNQPLPAVTQQPSPNSESDTEHEPNTQQGEQSGVFEIDTTGEDNQQVNQQAVESNQPPPGDLNHI